MVNQMAVFLRDCMSHTVVVLIVIVLPQITVFAESAPSAIELGIMQGRPVPRDNRVTLENWMTPPFNRWSLQHVPHILPTSAVDRGDGPVTKLVVREVDLGSVRFVSSAGEMLSVSQWLGESFTDGFIVLHDSEIVFEAYRNGMRPRTRHLSYSISKSVIGILAGILVDAGELDVDRIVEYYVPELRHSGFAGYTVRDLLDMRAAIEWSEDYEDSASSWRLWKEAIGWKPAAGSARAVPRGNYEFLPTLRRDSVETGSFKYVSPSAEVVGWVLERAGGKPLAELMSERLWVRLGVERDAYVTTDPSFAPSAAGGFGGTLRDIARFGQLVLNEGMFSGNRVVSRDWIADIRFNGDNDAWRDGQYRGYWNPSGAYRSFWYVTGDDDGSFEALGIHGQRLYINPARKIVIVRLSSFPDAVSRADYDLSSRVIAAIRSALPD